MKEQLRIMKREKFRKSIQGIALFIFLFLALDLQGQSLRLTDFNGGKFESGLQHWISFSWSGSYTEKVKLDYTINNGSTWSSITSSMPSGNIYNWPIPATPSTQCRIRVSLVSNPAIFDESDANFEIFVLPPSIEVSIPNGDETFLANTKRTIIWKKKNVNGANVDYTLDGTTWTRIITNNTNTYYDWYPPNTESITAKIRVTASDDPSITDQSDAAFRVVTLPPVITVTSPNGGENLTAGTVHNIKWTSTNIGKVKLDLLVDGVHNQTIATNISASIGTYAWAVPNIPSEKLTVRVSDASYSDFKDESNAKFKVFLPVQLAAPNGYETWKHGENRVIKWIRNNPIGNVKLEYTTDGTTWNVIAASVPAANLQYTWTIPALSSSSVKVRVSDVTSAVTNDVSDNDFRVCNCVQSLTVDNPIAGKSYLAGSELWIQPFLTNVYKVNMEYSTDNGTTWTRFYTSGGGGSIYLFSIPNVVTTTAKFKVYDVTDPNVKYETGIFSIYNPLKLVQPNGGEVFKPGSVQTIKWTSTSAVASVKLSYVDDTRYRRTIATNIPASDGSYTWTVPATAGDSIRVYVENINDYRTTDWSDNFFTIQKLDQTITFNPLPTKTYGDAPFNLDASSSAGYYVTYTSSNTAVATISSNQVKIVGAGTTVITAKQPGDINANAATNVSQTLTVNKAPVTLTFSSIPSRVYKENETFNLGVSLNVYLTPEVTSSNTSVATVSGTIATIKGGGKTTIKAKFPGNENYLPSNEISQELEIKKAEQYITYYPLPSGKAFGNAPFKIEAFSNVGLPVTFVSSNESIATISGNTVTIKGGGVVKISATQAGNNNYAPAQSIERELDVQKATQVITFNALPSKTFGDADFSLTATSTSGLPVYFSSSNESIAKVVDSKIEIVGAGTVEIHAGQLGNSNYHMAPFVTHNLVIKKAAQTITFPEIPAKRIKDPAFELMAAASSNLATLYEIVSGPASVSGNKVSLNGTAGTVTIKTTQAGNQNYLAATPVSVSFEVADKLPQTITFNAIEDKRYGDVADLIATGGNSGQPIIFSVLAGNGEIVNTSKLKITGIGTVTVRASQAGNDQYLPAVSKERSFNSDKGLQIINFPDIADQPFGSSPLNLLASSNFQTEVLFEVIKGNVQLNESVLYIKGAGSVTIKAFHSGNDYILPAAAERTFCVAPEKPEVTTNGTTTSAAFTLTSSSLEGNQWLKNGIEINGSTGTSYNVTSSGAYSVKVTIEGCSSVSENVVLTGSERPLAKDKYKIYPTVTEDDVNLELLYLPKGKVTITVANESGVRLVEKMLLKGSKSCIINIGSFAPGMYFISIQDGTFTSTEKIIKR